MKLGRVERIPGPETEAPQNRPDSRDAAAEPEQKAYSLAASPCSNPAHPVPCYVYYRDGHGMWQNNTSAHTLFEAAYKALCWFRDTSGPRPGAESILKIDAGWANQQKTYYVRVGRVLEHYDTTYREFFKAAGGRA